MALDLVVTENHKTPIWREETSIRFDEEPDYWFLYGGMLEEIKQHTGEMLDLYDDVKFAGQKLEQLDRIIRKTIDQIKAAPEKEWKVHLGTQLEPVHKELYGTLTKSALLQKLDKFAQMASLAIQKEEMIIGLGD